MKFLIRPASVHDAESVRNVHIASYEAAYRGLIPEEHLQKKREKHGAEWYAEMIDRPGTPRAGTWVAVAGDHMAGFGAFREGESPEVGALELFYLHPDHWGAGVARPLLDDLLDDMRVVGFRIARVEVFKEIPRARRFYERAGFRLAAGGESRVYGDRTLETVEYELAL